MHKQHNLLRYITEGYVFTFKKKKNLINTKFAYKTHDLKKDPAFCFFFFANLVSFDTKNGSLRRRPQNRN